MHTHVIINHDVGISLVVRSEDEDVDLVQIIDQLIIKELCHAEAGI